MVKKSRTASDRQEIVYLPIDSLKPDPRNARRHPEEQISQLRANIRKFGFYGWVLLKDDGETIGAGHGRWEAAKAEGMKEIACVVKKGLNAKQWRALSIADNKIAMNAAWDNDALLSELNALAGMFDLGELGFTVHELGILGVSGFELETRLEEADETPEVRKVPNVKVGELWILGDHRLVIGDSTNPEVVARVLSGRAKDLLPLVKLMVTDPPYGVNYDPAWRGTAKRAGTGKRLSLGVHAKGKVQNDDNADWRAAWALFPGDVAYVWHAGVHGGSVQASLEAKDFAVRSQIIWVKNNMVIGRGDYHWQHEPCLYAVRNGKPGLYVGDRKQTTVWEIAKPQRSETGHGTQKPVECMRRPILNNSKPGDAIYDPFCGSGTTLIAAHMEKRRCFAVELDPVYAQVIIERWEKFANATAKREDGKTLAQLKKKEN